MTFENRYDAPPEFDEFDMLLNVATGVIVRNEDPEEFQCWVNNSAPIFAPDLLGQLADDADRRMFMSNLGRAIWNATPLPGNEYQPRPLPKPGRNDPCFCGSGQKFKRCCSRMPFPDSIVYPELMLTKVLRTIPAKAFKELPYRKLSLEVLAAAARQWMDCGDARLAQKLLEPIFADVSKLDECAEFAFDVLADCYDVLHHPRKKRMLLDKLANGVNRELRSAALQRLTTMLADEEKVDQAWECFRDAQRASPDDPNLSTLEVLLLTTQGKPELARERARYWIARFKRDKDRDLNDLIELLENMADDNNSVMFDVSSKHTPGLGELKDFIGQVPPPVSGNYDIEFDENEGIGVLTPDKNILLLEKRWQQCVPVGKPALTSLSYFEQEDPWGSSIAHTWLEFLKVNPQALDSIDILDDVVLCVRQLEDADLPWIADQLLRPLMVRAEELLMDAVSCRNLDNRTIPWVAMDNRPALRLLCGLIYLDLDLGRYADALPRMERMVYEFNPVDNHGMRADLLEAYLRRAEYEKALALAAKYPNDGMPDLVFGRVLALCGLKQRDKAAQALADARENSPLIIKYLTAKNPRKPKFSGFGISVGGKDEAWIYRDKYLDLWELTDAISLLKSSNKKSSTGENTTRDIPGF